MMYIEILIFSFIFDQETIYWGIDLTNLGGAATWVFYTAKIENVIALADKIPSFYPGANNNFHITQVENNGPRKWRLEWKYF